jgi:23S rRNA pseudouridine2605 synthase
MADERESDQGQRDTFVRREGARDNQEEQSPQRVRLQRYLADAGVAARRACEEMIEEGRVEVNGEIITKLPAFVDPQQDKVRVDGRAVAKPQSALTLLVHKPQRVLVTASDEPGMDRATILDLVNHPAGARLFPVGRLGWDDAGLVVLTNDGELANALSHPRFGVPKRYEVLVAGAVEVLRFGRESYFSGLASAASTVYIVQGEGM